MANIPQAPLSVSRFLMDSAAVAIVFIIGAPGSGKGTLCQRLSEEYRFSHLSIGDLLRALTSSCTDIDIVNSVQNGELVPVEVLAPILKNHIEKEKQGGQRTVLVDGFPRRLDQATTIESLIGSPVLVLFFNCPEDIAQRRFLTRRLPGREADDDRTFRKRYQEFAKLNPEITEMYQRRGILLEVDTSEETGVSYQKLLRALNGTDIWRLLAAWI